MFFDKPMVLHSKQEDGRHWLTTLDMPPMQILPVAPNHCRVAHFLATLLSAKLAKMESDIPEEIVLSQADVVSVPSFSGRYPELKTKGGEVRIRLALMKAPPEIDDEADDDEPAEFVTPQPPSDWKGDYDSWIMDVGRKLGVDVPEPCGPEGYEHAMADAAAEVQMRLPTLRKRFVDGMKGLNLGFKVGLKTSRNGKEFVWVRPTDWSNEKTLTCVLESRPRDCKGFKLGQTLNLPVADLLDYVIGSETAGMAECGPTQRVAEDYGLVIP